MLYNPQLKTFLAVADAGSFNKASEILFISSTAVIKQINSLETSIGIQLFHRSNQGLELTPAGTSLYADAKYLIQYSEDALHTAKEAERKNGLIRIAISPFNPSEYLSDILPALQETCPDLHFELIQYTNSYREVTDMLQTLGEKADIIIGACDRNMFHSSHTKVLVLQENPVTVAVPCGNPLVAKSILTTEDFKNETLLLLEKGLVPHIDALRKDLVKHRKDIHLEDASFYDFQSFNRCSQNGWIMAMLTDANIHPMLCVKQVDWDYVMPFGVIYSDQPSEPVKQVLVALKHLYKNCYEL